MEEKLTPETSVLTILMKVDILDVSMKFDIFLVLRDRVCDLVVRVPAC
jgi:hypothetical protein